MRHNVNPMDYDLDENERAVLDVLRDEGRVNPLRIRKATGIRKQYVNDALRPLRKLGVVERVNEGLYEYVPAEDELEGAPTGAVGDVDAEALQRALDDAEAAAERGDGAELQDALRRARGAIDDA